MPVASSIEADAADGNLDKRKGRIIIVDYTRGEKGFREHICDSIGGKHAEGIDRR